MPSRKIQTIKSHRPEPGKPLRVSRGTVLTFERKPTEWPGWIWCTNDSGLSAWVPEAWVEIDEDTCRMVRDYDSHELTVEKGVTVSVEFEESGWAWVTTESGERGWIPLDCLDT